MRTMRNHRYELSERHHFKRAEEFSPTPACDRAVVEHVAAQIIEDAGTARAKRILDIADATERGETKVTWVTGMSREQRRERLFRKMPRS